MPYIRSLTSMRGYCALTIVACHYHFFIQPIPFVPLQQFLRYATNGVDFFFIMSGFFLSYIYREQFAKPNLAKHNIGRFWLYRFGRIYPLHVVTLLFFAGLIALGWTEDTGTLLVANDDNETPTFFIANLLMYHGWGVLAPEDTGSFNHPSWSLSIEVFIYLVFPLLALLCFRVQHWLINLLAIGGIYTFLCLTIHDKGVLFTPKGDAIYTLVLWKDDVVRGLMLFVTGVALSNLHRQHFLKKLPLKITWGIIAAVTTLIGTSLILHDVKMNYVILLSPLLIYALSHLNEKEEKIFSNPVCFYLGEISYSIYMWHIPYALVVHHFYPLTTGDLWQWIWIPLFLGLIAVSALSYHLIENPCRMAVKKWGKKHPQEKMDKTET